MTTDAAPTINQLMDLFLLSRNRGEWVKLSMESKDGKDSVTFSLGSPAGPSVEQPKACSCSPGTTSPMAWPPLPTRTGPRRRKTPSQYRRDKIRREQFFAKKTASAVVKEETVDENHKSGHLMENPSDEIELEKIPEDDSIDIKIGDLFKIKGEYKNNKFKPWSKIEPENEIKVLWSDINTVNKEKGIEEIGEGSTCFEHCFEFWGTWRVKKENITVDVLKDSENWPKGVKITEVKPA